MRVLLIESFIFLGCARILKSLPFSKVAPLLGEKMQETYYEIDLKNLEEVKNITNAIYIASNYTFWESKCLVRAIAAMKMLERRNIESTLYLGTNKDSDGNLAAHAWLRTGNYYVTGAYEMKDYTMIVKFAKKIRKKNIR
ncbi:lasso peptide biosynthesis B2 protein [Metabacillus indicus]|nr:lasso peptide biosynthesis B2 protein [Metabacillus indicus]